MMPHLGTSTIYGNILPNFNQLMKIYGKPLSKEAKHRLQVLDYLREKAHGNVSLTARHFGCTRSYIYKWLNRFLKASEHSRLAALESRSTRPKHTRSVQYSLETVSYIRRIRQAYPSYSARKITVILARDYDVIISPATAGRIIKRYNMFYSKLVDTHFKRSRAARESWQTRKAKERLRYYKKPEHPRHIIEFDMKHISNGGCSKQYALCAIDPFTKEAMIHISSSPSSLQGKLAMQKVLARFGKDSIIICDNGSENFGETRAFLDEMNVRQIFTRVHTPKDKPHIENFIGKYQLECLNESEACMYTVRERQEEADKWLNDWHFFRPNQALNYLTPAEYCATIGITIPRAESVHDVVS